MVGAFFVLVFRLQEPMALGIIHAEALTNAVVGILVAQLILWLFGIPLRSAIALNVACSGRATPGRSC
jgi:hypothetical protein